MTLANLATTKTHNVSYNPVTVTSANLAHSQTTNVHHVPPQVPHVPPPTQETPKTNQETEQLKIDLKKARRTIGISPVKVEDLQFFNHLSVLYYLTLST